MINFYAEHRHKVVARKPSQCFTIRFYQIGGENTRQFLWRTLETPFSGAENERYAALKNEARGWIHDILPTYRTEEREINDVLGLARFLVRWRRFNAQASAGETVDETERGDLENPLVGGCHQRCGLHYGGSASAVCR